jgi:hypothetical protein
MMRFLSFIASVFTYWMPLLVGAMMLLFSFVQRSVSLALCGAIVIVTASLARLAFRAADRNKPEAPSARSAAMAADE